MYQAKSGVKNFSLYCDRVPPPPDLRLGTPPPGPVTPPPGPETGYPPPPGPETGYPPPTWTWEPSPPKCEQTETITFPHPSDGGR